MVHYTLKVMWTGYNLQKQKGGRGLTSCEMCVKTEENNLAWYWYVRNSKERLMKVVRKTKIHNSEGAKEKNEFKQQQFNTKQAQSRSCHCNHPWIHTYCLSIHL